jgi:hypothetical protein
MYFPVVEICVRRFTDVMIADDPTGTEVVGF